MSVSMRRRSLLAAGIGGPLFAPRPQAAEAVWPQRAVRVLIGYGPGGLPDAYARAYGEYVTQRTGQPWLVEYKPGAGGSIAAVELKRTAPDGHTLFFTTSNTLIQNRLTYRTLPYDPDKDLALVTFMPAGNLPLAISPARTGATNLREFIDYARANSKVSVGTYGPGTLAHMAFSELNRQFGLDMAIVHYRGAIQMWIDIAGGVLDAGIGSYASVIPFLQKGVVRVIATLPGRIRALPTVASCTEQGTTSPAFRIEGYQACIATGGTPPAIIERISDVLQEAARTEKVRSVLATFGIDQAALGVEESRRRYVAEAPLWFDLVKSLGLTPE